MATQDAAGLHSVRSAISLILREKGVMQAGWPLLRSVSSATASPIRAPSSNISVLRGERGSSTSILPAKALVYVPVRPPCTRYTSRGRGRMTTLARLVAHAVPCQSRSPQSVAATPAERLCRYPDVRLILVAASWAWSDVPYPTGVTGEMELCPSILADATAHQRLARLKCLSRGSAWSSRAGPSTPASLFDSLKCQAGGFDLECSEEW